MEPAVVVSDGCTYVSLSGENIKYISLPDSVTEYYIWETGITEFEVPAGVKVVTKLPPTLEKISFRGAPEEIEFDAFSGTKIKTITLPDSIKGIKSRAFENCIALESINFPASLEWIGVGGYGTNTGEATFNGCSNLKEIIIPDSLTSVSFPKILSVFEGCSSLPLATQARLRQLGYEKYF
ncbi:MAG: leucine-rich repeat domain-containing protein [Spirochaetaceae bacterium]|nr:leucine-rich repeat domain-containing protein [Spirochaetaceae bacterium]